MNFSEIGQNWTISQNLSSSPEKFCCDRVYRTVLSFELPGGFSLHREKASFTVQHLSDSMPPFLTLVATSVSTPQVSYVQKLLKYKGAIDLEGTSSLIMEIKNGLTVVKFSCTQ